MVQGFRQLFKVLVQLMQSIPQVKPVKQAFNPANRVALVTGGSGGIGLSITLGLQSDGARVDSGARRNDKLSVGYETGVHCT